MVSKIVLDKNVNVDSLWLIDKRDSSGKHSNVYHGNFIPQIPNNLIRRYTNEGDLVVDLFLGSGTTLFECEKLNRHFIGFDLNQDIIDLVHSKMDEKCPINFEINNCDVTNDVTFSSAINNSLDNLGRGEVDFFIAHPPYLDIVKFTEEKGDLSAISDINLFVPKFIEAIGNIYPFLQKNRYFAVVIGDVYKNSEVIPLGFYLMDAIA